MVPKIYEGVEKIDAKINTIDFGNFGKIRHRLFIHHVSCTTRDKLLAEIKINVWLKGKSNTRL